VSQIILDYAKPFLPDADDPDYESKLAFAILMWNFSYLPENDIPTALNLLAKGTPNDLVGELIQRAEEHIRRRRQAFAEVEKYVVDFSIKRTRHEVNLAVISTPIPPKGSDEFSKMTGLDSLR
jgi:hypothetical protein